jgi:hypothetical protein
MESVQTGNVCALSLHKCKEDCFWGGNVYYLKEIDILKPNILSGIFPTCKDINKIRLLAKKIYYLKDINILRYNVYFDNFSYM